MINVTDFWQNIIDMIESEGKLPSLMGFGTWVKTIKPYSYVNNILTLSVPMEMNRIEIKNRYLKYIQSAANILNGGEVDIRIELEDDLRDMELNGEFIIQSTPIDESFYLKTGLIKKYTFDNYVIGENNRFAWAGAKAIAQAPGTCYNPFFLYGYVGLGKTHLMHAIGNYILQNNPDAKILFLSAEKFTTELIEALRDNKTQEFRNKYRNIDVLLVDDIQFIAGKSATEEEFFHTFNTLRDANKQIVLTSDRPPREIKTLEERLRSRFEWGLICDIQPPDFETRMAILSKKAKDENISISDEIIEYIAQNVKSNIRELEGVFNRVVAYRGLIKKEITLDLVIETLKDYADTSSHTLTPEYIIEYCANFYNVKKEDIYSEKRNKEIVFARQVCLYIIRELTDYSLSKIGLIFGKDHATVLYAIKKLTTIMEKDLSIKISIESLMKDISEEKLLTFFC